MLLALPGAVTRRARRVDAVRWQRREHGRSRVHARDHPACAPRLRGMGARHRPSSAAHCPRFARRACRWPRRCAPADRAGAFSVMRELVPALDGHAAHAFFARGGGVAERPSVFRKLVAIRAAELPAAFRFDDPDAAVPAAGAFAVADRSRRRAPCVPASHSVSMPSAVTVTDGLPSKVSFSRIRAQRLEEDAAAAAAPRSSSRCRRRPSGRCRRQVRSRPDGQRLPQSDRRNAADVGSPALRGPDRIVTAKDAAARSCGARCLPAAPCGLARSMASPGSSLL